MIGPRGLLGATVLLIIVVGATDVLWALGPRYTSCGRGHVLEVQAPNVVRVRLAGQDRTLSVRLLGVGSPKNRDRIKGLDHEIISYIQKNGLWDESRKYVQSLVQGKLVEVWTRKWDRLDDKNRLLAYLIVPNGGPEPLDVNGEIIRNGLGFVTRDYVHVTFADYKRLEDDARKNRRGIWRGLPMDRYSSLSK